MGSGITFTAKGSTQRETITESVEEYVWRAIVNEGGGRRSDLTERNASSALSAVARLTQILVDKGVLDVNDVLQIAHNQAFAEEAEHKLADPVPG